MDQEHSGESRENPGTSRARRHRSVARDADDARSPNTPSHNTVAFDTRGRSAQGPVLLTPRALLCVGAVLWVASVSMTSRGITETSPWRTVSQARWETVCPGCGTVESVSQMQEPRGAVNWRVEVRTSSGWLRPFHSDTALALGQRVVVDGDRVRATEASTCR